MTADDPDREGAPVADELRSQGVSVESVDTQDPLAFTYLTAFPADEVHRREVGRACNALLDLADSDDWQPVRVEATAVRSPGDVLGAWHAEPEWFRALLDDAITETEFSTRVVNTISHADGNEASEGTTAGTSEKATAETDEGAVDNPNAGGDV